MLYEDISIYWKKMYIPVYFIGFLDKWSLFIHEEFEKKGPNCYFAKQRKIKRYENKKIYGIANREIYDYVMKRIISFCPFDINWENYYYYFYLIPKDIILTYYIVLKERGLSFLRVLSDLRVFLETVIRLGGITGYCRKIKIMFVDQIKDYFEPIRSKKQFEKFFLE